MAQEDASSFEKGLRYHVILLAGTRGTTGEQGGGGEQQQEQGGSCHRPLLDWIRNVCAAAWKVWRVDGSR